MSLNLLKFFKQIVPVMHISVRHDIFYNISSGVIDVENKDTFIGYGLRRPSIYASSFAPNERPYRVT